MILPSNIQLIPKFSQKIICNQTSQVQEIKKKKGDRVSNLSYVLLCSTYACRILASFCSRTKLVTTYYVISS